MPAGGPSRLSLIDRALNNSPLLTSLFRTRQVDCLTRGNHLKQLEAACQDETPTQLDFDKERPVNGNGIFVLTLSPRPTGAFRRRRPRVSNGLEYN